jgi:hypothetical protein
MYNSCRQIWQPPCCSLNAVNYLIADRDRNLAIRFLLGGNSKLAPEQPPNQEQRPPEFVQRGLREVNETRPLGELPPIVSAMLRHSSPA